MGAVENFRSHLLKCPQEKLFYNTAYVTQHKIIQRLYMASVVPFWGQRSRSPGFTNYWHKMAHDCWTDGGIIL